MLRSGTVFHKKSCDLAYAFGDTVECSTSVDAFAKALRLQSTVPKRDMERFELEVLRGARTSLT
jgi:hypothetical protein